MTHSAVLANAGFVPPGPEDFVFSGHILLWKSSVLLVLGGLIVIVFFLATSRKAGVVPSKLQYAGEVSYSFVRDTIGRDIIGDKDFLRYVPLLVTSFFFVLINNLFGMVPFLQFPSFSRLSFAAGMAIIVWLIYNGVGIARFGPGHYLKNQCIPAGVPGWILPLLIPLEFLSNILIRPITLALRLFANMFAGHLLIMLFALGGDYLLLHATGPIVKAAGVMSFALGIAVGFLELLVAFLQAYVFTLLTASYIQGALASDH